MKVRVNERMELEIYKEYEESVLKENKVCCWQIKCLSNDDIDCEECCFNKVSPIKYSKIKVEDKAYELYKN